MPKTANDVTITDGMTVWDNNLRRVTIDLSFSFEENGEFWFNTSGGMSSESRVSTVHPFTGEKA